MKLWLNRVIVGCVVVEDHIKQGPVHVDAAVVINKPKLTKAIHEEVDSGSCGANHLGESFL